MDFLPREILNEILECLSLVDRIKTRLVSKKWRDITPSFKMDDLGVLKDKIFEIMGVIALSNLNPLLSTRKDSALQIEWDDMDGWNNGSQNSIFVIRDCALSVITKVKITVLNNRTSVRREIYQDLDYMFTDMDDVDGFEFTDGMKKVFSNLRDLIKITGMDQERSLYHNQSIIFDRNYEKSSLFYDPISFTNKTFDVLRKITNSQEYDWFEKRWHENLNPIIDKMKSNFSKTKRKEELSKMIWVYCFSY
jgi:hypothetical protein